MRYKRWKNDLPFVSLMEMKKYKCWRQPPRPGWKPLQKQERFVPELNRLIWAPDLIILSPVQAWNETFFCAFMFFFNEKYFQKFWNTPDFFRGKLNEDFPEVFVGWINRSDLYYAEHNAPEVFWLQICSGYLRRRDGKFR